MADTEAGWPGTHSILPLFVCLGQSCSLSSALKIISEVSSNRISCNSGLRRLLTNLHYSVFSSLRLGVTGRDEAMGGGGGRAIWAGGSV